MTSPTFWLLWLATVGVCLAAMVKAWHTPREFLGLPPMACLMWLYFHGYMAYNAVTRLAADRLADVPEAVWELGQGVALLAIVALLLGWYTGRALLRSPRRAKTRGQWSYATLWWMGLLCMVVGALGIYTFQGQETVNWQESSAYWYELFHIGYPGAAICLLVLIQSPAHRSWRCRALYAGILVLAMYPHVIAARRGPLFPMVIGLLYTYALVRQRRPNRSLVLGTLAVTGVAMLFFVQARAYIYHEGTWGDAFRNVTLAETVTSKASQIDDNEFVYSCFLITTNLETGLYQYGTGCLSLLTHWIPRQLWPEKPGRGGGWFEDARLSVGSVMGRQMTAGAAPGGVASLFNEFGWGAPVFWFLLGWVAAWIYARARQSGEERWQIAFVGMMSVMHWLISQGFGAAAVPAVVYQLVPFVLFAAAHRSWRIRAVTGHGARVTSRDGTVGLVPDSRPSARSAGTRRDPRRTGGATLGVKGIRAITPRRIA